MVFRAQNWKNWLRRLLFPVIAIAFRRQFTIRYFAPSDKTDDLEAARVNKSIELKLHDLKAKPRKQYVPPPLSSPQNAFQEVQNAVLVGRAPVAFDAVGRLILDSVFRTDERSEKAMWAIGPRRWNVRGKGYYLPQQTAQLEGSVCLLASSWDHYGHWVPEHLLKVKHLAELRDIADMTFIIRPDTTGYKRNFLRRAGIRDRMIYEWQGDGPLRVEKLVVPRYPEISRESLHWISSLFPEIDSATSGRVYLSRQGVNRRKFVNFEEVEEVLNELGFKTLMPERCSLEDQVAAMRGATALFGPHGSAFTNQIFCLLPADVIEVFGEKVPQSFRQMALVLGHRHHAMLGRATSRHGGDNGGDIYVDRKVLQSFIERVLDI